VVAYNRLDSTTQEDLKRSMFIKSVLSITRVQALHVNNPAFLSRWRQEHEFCPTASKERVAFPSNELMDCLCQCDNAWLLSQDKTLQPPDLGLFSSALHF